MAELTECYRQEGRLLAPTRVMDEIREDERLETELILAPPSIFKDGWAKRLGRYRTAFASGWMAGSGSSWGRGYDHGFVMSDHADWNDLNRTIDETGASRVFVQHRDGALIQHLRRRGIDAHPIESLTEDHYPRLAPVELRLF